MTIDGSLRQVLGLLPIVPLALLFAVLRRHHSNRRAGLLAATIWAAVAVALAETLSLVRQINEVALAAAWLLVTTPIAILYLKHRARAPRHPIVPRARSRIDTLLACGIGAVLVATLFTALLTPPNNWDAMTYHMARVIYWMQHGTLAHFPTSNLRQLHQSPGSEMLILQFQLLAGGDRFANFVQWLALAGSITGASLIAQQLGTSRRGQLVAAAFVAGLPMATLQASNAQNDLAVGFWIVCLASFLLWGMEAEQAPIGTAVIAAGAALGLAILTKATAFLFAFPLCVWFAATHLRRFGRRAAPAGVLIAAMLVALNLGPGVRNARLYGSPLGPMQEVFASRTHTYTNSVFTPATLVSNLIRNLATQALTPSVEWGRRVASAVTRLHELLGLDVHDQRTTWQGDTFRLEPRLWNHSDVAPAPLHLALVTAAVVSWPAWRKRLPRRVSTMLLCVIAALLLFSFVLRWQPWHARLHLPMWLLAAAPLGAVAASFRAAGPTIAAIVLAAVWPAMVLSRTHPWVGERSMFRLPRFEQYFMVRPVLVEPFTAIRLIIADHAPACVGLEANEDEYVYPLWALLHEHDPAVRIENLNVSNVSGKLMQPGESCQPQLVIVLKAGVGDIAVRPWAPADERQRRGE